MSLPKVFEKLASKYKKNSIVRSLVQLIPCGIGSAFDVGISTHLENIREERATTFFDELAAGKQEITPELLESNDFLHCFFITTSAAMRTRRKEKIRMFANLLKSSCLHDNFANIDEYEEYLGILDDMSYRELSILNILERYEQQNPYREGDEDNDLLLANKYWDKFVKELTENMGIPKNEISSILTRLNRTGCYELFTGKYWDAISGQGKLTQTYKRLKNFIINKS